MFVVKLYKGSDIIDIEKCAIGDLLPTVASLMQRHEGDGWQHQQQYAVQWTLVNES